jgi:hypothetical protein
VHLISQKSLELVLNEQDMAYGSEGGENVRFKDKKSVFVFVFSLGISFFNYYVESKSISKQKPS